MSDIDEYKALTSTLSSFYHFDAWEIEDVVIPRERKYDTFTSDEKELLPWYDKHTLNLRECIGINAQFTQALAVNIAQDWGVSSNPADWEPATASEFNKVKFTLLQLAREWSSEGEVERDVTFDRILKELEEMYPDRALRQLVHILNPGCGLGRLVLELVKRGFWCQGNEFSYHMLLASNFVLNHCKMPHNYSLLPYLHKSSNLVKRLYQTRPITVPDVNPLEIRELQQAHPEIPYDELMSMTAGSFIDLYGPDNLSISNTYSDDPVANEFRTENKESFDCLVTSFFLDTAVNIIDYVKTIHHCLKQGGTWINFGPLLWHFENEEEPRGLELSREDLVDLVAKLGFEFIKRESGVETTYGGDRKSLGVFVYKCEYWVARKK